jgi:putative acetyltransferase
MMVVNRTHISTERPDSPQALELLAELDDELHKHPYPAESRHAFSVEQLLREQVAFFVVRYDNQPAGCGGVKIFNDYGEVKRMYVRRSLRGLGLGKAILAHLADHTRAQGIQILRLETGCYQSEAIRLYERFGFSRRPPFGEYREDPLSVYFEKTLD